VSAFADKPELLSCDLNNDRLPLAFAALREPNAQAFGKALRRQTKACLDFAIGEGQGIVKISRIREIPHAKLIEPIEGAGAALAANHNIYSEFLRVHTAIITSRHVRILKDGSLQEKPAAQN
jgi:hypothetical protein